MIFLFFKSPNFVKYFVKIPCSHKTTSVNYAIFLFLFFSAIGNPHPRTIVEGNLVRDILYGSRENVNFVHEVYRQSFLLSFSHSPAIKKVISVYKGRAHHIFSPIPKLRIFFTKISLFCFSTSKKFSIAIKNANITVYHNRKKILYSPLKNKT